MKTTKLRLVSRGAPIVSGLVAVVAKSRELVALDVPMASKYCDVNAAIGDDEPGISIYAPEEAIKLDDRYKRDEDTIVCFPEFKGWEYFASSSGRYNIRVCLIRRK